jgi:hypothetical protein
MVGFTTSIQYERWLFPIIQPGPQRDISASIGIQIQPQKIWPSFHHAAPNSATEGNQN